MSDYELPEVEFEDSSDGGPLSLRIRRGDDKFRLWEPASDDAAELCNDAFRLFAAAAEMYRVMEEGIAASKESAGRMASYYSQGKCQGCFTEKGRRVYLIDADAADRILDKVRGANKEERALDAIMFKALSESDKWKENGNE